LHTAVFRSMRFIGITLVLGLADAVAASLLGDKNPAIDALQKLQAKIDAVTSFQDDMGRRLQGGIMSAGCQEACPGIMDLMAYMMKMSSEPTSTTPSPNAQMTMMCPHAEAMVCMMTEKSCQEEGAEDQSGTAGMIMCICECPGLTAMTDGDGGDSSEKMCNDWDGTLGCMDGKESCKSFQDMMVTTVPGGMTSLAIGCRGITLGCPEKEENLMTCAGDEVTAWGSNGCDDAAHSKSLADKSTADCCTHAEKITECVGLECTKLKWAGMKLMAGQGDFTGTMAKKEMEKSLEIGKVCTGTGLPASEADLQSTIDNAENGFDPPADFAQAQAASSLMLMITATMLAVDV